eukprot:CAMPEP_0206476278 /NCGR_PEP_ID=MMETSP0324_2-20121206/34622_1 /ASSEMBLY_ACC=CAM_ASM_000836 /TAXON_ID=2866 /ORGANISM="Crypthecodinium cohnii, Strain Seligo" /LENGTH=121 /DNA_ID=CAMNT_0053951881 /DNA_START=355 /DNA_END=716 /DNA_ORIENTATION=+
MAEASRVRGTSEAGSSTGDSELYKELELLEVALTEERLRTRKVEEQLDEAKLLHASEVKALEDMLQQLLDENEELKAKVAAYESRKAEKEGQEEKAIIADPSKMKATTSVGGKAEVEEPEV